MTAPTAVDLALQVRDLLDRQNIDRINQDWAERVEATVQQILTAANWGDEQDLDRNQTALEISDGSHDGVDPTRTNDNDWAPVLAHCPTSNTPAVEDVVYVGWPCSVKVVRVA